MDLKIAKNFTQIGFLCRTVTRSSNPIPLFFIADHFEIQFIVFTPDGVDFEKDTVTGVSFINGEWRDIVTKIPKITFNAILSTGKNDAFFCNLEKHSYILRDNPHFNKQHIYELLKNDGKFEGILIPSKYINSFSDIVEALKQTKDIILKPTNWNQGRGIIKISQTVNKKKYLIIRGIDQLQMTLEDLQKFFNENIVKGAYLWQPYIASVTKKGEPFDIRLAAIRGKTGDFQITYYPRIGNSEGVVSNVESGGYTTDFWQFLKYNFSPNEIAEITGELKKLNGLPAHYANLCTGKKIFDLGFDFGFCKIDGKYKPFLFEVNICLATYKICEIHVIMCQHFRYLADKLKDS